jgi:conjugal transfer pilus assembly protein TraD
MERQTEKEVPLFAPELLGMLPNLEFVGILSGGQIVKGRYPLIVEKKK